MNILIISHLYPGPTRPNYGTFVYQQVRELQLLGHKPVVVSPILWSPSWLPLPVERWESNRKLPISSIYNGIKTFYLRGLSFPKHMLHLKGYLYYLTMFRAFKNIIEEYCIDIIHAHTVIPDGDLALHLKKRFNLPVVITIHGADLQIHIHKNLRLQKHILSIISKADAIGLVSQKLFQILDRYITQQQRKKLNIIHNGIQIYNNYDNVEWGDDEKNIRIITIANLIEQKGFKYVFKALGELREKFKNITYFIIGSGWDEDRIKRQAREHGLEKEVKFLGKMPHKVAMSYLKNADIFIMLSENESFGIVYIEAMYLKTITIGSIGEGISEVISNNENGFLVNPKNSQNIKELLEYILKNYKHMSELKEKAHSDVWPKFSWRNNAKLYIDLYKNIQKNFHNS